MPVARSRVSWRPKDDLPSEPSRFAQRLVAEEVGPLLGQLELDRRAGGPDAAPARRIVEGLRLPSSEVALAHHALHGLLEELVHARARRP